MGNTSKRSQSQNNISGENNPEPEYQFILIISP